MELVSTTMLLLFSTVRYCRGNLRGEEGHVGTHLVSLIWEDINNLMYYDGFECCQCRWPILGKYPTGERDIDSKLRRFDKVWSGIDSIQRDKERLAWNTKRQWTVRSDGAVRCAGSEGNVGMMPPRSGMTYYYDRISGVYDEALEE